MTLEYVIWEIGRAVIRYLRYDWWILALGIGTAVVLQVYLGDRLVQGMRKKSATSIIGAVGVGAFTPFCACGTMAVLLSMFVSSLPWGTVMAFLLTSPLTSPTQVIFQAGFLGSRLAAAGMISALALGLAGGVLASYLERNTSFFKDQYRLAPPGCGCSASRETACCGVSVQQTAWYRRWKLDQVARQTYELGVKRVLLYFMLFIALGRLVELFIPSEAILLLFSPDRFYSVPLAAVIGLPLYVSGSAGLPLLESFLEAGAGEGSVLAFLIAGQGTSVAVMVGIATILRKKAIAFYVGLVLAGGIIFGLLYQFLAAFF
jgi:uncharacterized protein